jgi:hypothetical protein
MEEKGQPSGWPFSFPPQVQGPASGTQKKPQQSESNLPSAAYKYMSGKIGTLATQGTTIWIS